MQTDNGSQVAGTLEVEDASGGVHRLATSLLDYLDAQFGANRLAVSAQDAEALPFDFWGGYVGYLGYEMKVPAATSPPLRSPCPESTACACAFPPQFLPLRVACIGRNLGIRDRLTS